MNRKDFEEELHARICDFLMIDGYKKSEDYVCIKNVGDAVVWRIGGYLSNRKPPYAVFSTISCEYISASLVINKFLEKYQIEKNPNFAVGFGSELERHTAEKSVLRISSDNSNEVAIKLGNRIKEGVEKYLLPRIDQRVVVDEYLNNPPHKWASADLLQCCLTIISYGLISEDPIFVRAGVDRALEILNRPNYSQMHKNTLESIKCVAYKKF